MTATKAARGRHWCRIPRQTCRALAQQRQAAQVQQEDSGFAVPTFDFSGQINRLQRSLQLPKLPSMTGMIQKFERASGVDFKKMGKYLK